jgi:hypothetical protein
MWGPSVTDVFLGSGDRGRIGNTHVMERIRRSLKDYEGATPIKWGLTAAGIAATKSGTAKRAGGNEQHAGECRKQLQDCA